MVPLGELFLQCFRGVVLNGILDLPFLVTVLFVPLLLDFFEVSFELVAVHIDAAFRTLVLWQLLPGQVTQRDDDRVVERVRKVRDRADSLGEQERCVTEIAGDPNSVDPRIARN